MQVAVNKAAADDDDADDELNNPYSLKRFMQRFGTRALDEIDRDEISGEWIHREGDAIHPNM